MARRYVAFDIETAREISESDFDWRPHRPLGICCAAALPGDSQQVTTWSGGNKDGTRAARMSREDVRAMLRELAGLAARGCTILTWNGLGFDFDILAEESGQPEVCRDLALDHVDMMFHVFCDRGFPVALERAAQAFGFKAKPPGMSGLLAPRLWAEGRHDEVLRYVEHDVSATLRLGLMSEGARQFKWITRRGQTGSMDLPHGWLTVREAMKLPEPDTSWMDHPIPRERFTAWLGNP